MDIYPDTLPTKEKDELGYWSYAERIAKVFEDPPQEGVVASINGPWGTGKSTLLNFVREHLEGKISLLSFNPWWFSSQEDLTRRFLNEFGANLITRGVLQEERTWANLMKYAKVVGGIVKMAPGGGGVGRGIETITNTLDEPMRIRALKNSVANSLNRAGHRVVFIDEIDRLTSEQMRSVFQLVRSIADFPKTSYLLAFDRELVANALSTEQGAPGNRYLEKIVQVPFDIPVPDSATLRSVLQNFVFQDFEDAKGPFSRKYWVRMYQNGMSSSIRNLRDVKRLANALALTYPSVCDQVNATDFAALELLRIRYPDLYDYVRRNPAVFAKSSPVGENRNETNRREEWQDQVPDRDQKNAGRLVSSIFPHVAKGQRTVDNWDEFKNWETQHRACHPSFFSEYFQFKNRPPELTDTERDRLYRLLETPAEFATSLEDIERNIPTRKENTIHLFLDDILENESIHKDNFDHSQALESLVGSSDIVSRLPQRKNENDFSNTRLLAKSILQVWNDWEESEKSDVKRVVRKISSTSVGLLASVYIEDEDHGFFSFDETLRTEFLKTIRLTDDTELSSLIEPRNAKTIFEAAEELGNLSQVFEITRSVAEEPEYLTRGFTKSYLGQTGEYQRLDGEALARYLGPSFDQFIERVQDLVDKATSYNQTFRNTVRRFLNDYEEDREKYQSRAREATHEVESINADGSSGS